jgi:tRNA(Ile)-lysidine synthase
MRSKIKSTIEEHRLLSPGEHVLVAVSGGADSMALLFLLKQLAPEFSLTLSVGHVEHGLRGEESRADEAFVREWAARWDVPVYVGRFDVPAYAKERGVSFEVAAREVRYKYLRDTAAAIGARKIAFAHHANDQVETILMRFLRGTSPTGLSGIPLIRDMNGIQIIRPLLYIWKNEIEDFCRKEGIDYRTDSSNRSVKYFRNKIRLNLLPHLEHEYNKNVQKVIYQLGEIQRDEDRYMEEEAGKALERVTKAREKGRYTLDNAAMRMLPVALQRRVIKLILYYLSEHTREWESAHIEGIRRLIHGDAPHAQVDLAQHIRAYREYHLLHMVCRKEEPSLLFTGAVPLRIPGRTEIPELGIRVDAFLIDGAHASPDSEWEARFDYDRLACHPLEIRTRRAGDVLRPFGMTGTKKIKDLLMEAKVPRRDRDRWPLLIWNDQIEWVIGIRRGRGAVVTPNTRRTLCIRVTLSRG